jgi:hypothetical protein
MGLGKWEIEVAEAKAHVINDIIDLPYVVPAPLNPTILDMLDAVFEGGMSFGYNEG